MATAAMSETRPTVLVVEDEFIIALDLSETVKDLGYVLEGPFADKQNAFTAIGKGMPDCAILEGAISGRALYDGRLDPTEALALIAEARRAA